MLLKGQIEERLNIEDKDKKEKAELETTKMNIDNKYQDKNIEEEEKEYNDNYYNNNTNNKVDRHEIFSRYGICGR